MKTMVNNKAILHYTLYYDQKVTEGMYYTIKYYTISMRHR